MCQHHQNRRCLRSCLHNLQIPYRQSGYLLFLQWLLRSVLTWYCSPHCQTIPAQCSLLYSRKSWVPFPSGSHPRSNNGQWNWHGSLRSHQICNLPAYQRYNFLPDNPPKRSKYHFYECSLRLTPDTGVPARTLHLRNPRQTVPMRIHHPSYPWSLPSG